QGHDTVAVVWWCDPPSRAPGRRQVSGTLSFPHTHNRDKSRHADLTRLRRHSLVMVMKPPTLDTAITSPQSRGWISSSTQDVRGSMCTDKPTSGPYCGALGFAWRLTFFRCCCIARDPPLALSPPPGCRRLARQHPAVAVPPWCCDLRPALGRHELGPALVKVPMVALADAEVTGPGPEVLVEAFVASSHRIVQLLASGHHPPAGLGALLPVVHVVL